MTGAPLAKTTWAAWGSAKMLYSADRLSRALSRWLKKSEYWADPVAPTDPDAPYDPDSPTPDWDTYDPTKTKTPTRSED